MNSVAVTGATGFIGGYLVRQLLADGKRVRVLVRDPDRLPRDIRGRVDIVVGDIRDAGSVERAVTGAAIVLHLAACARAWSRDPSVFAETNVRGTENVVAAASRHRVERLVHVSTVLTLPEFGEPSSQRRVTPYERTKRVADDIIEAYARNGRHASIVHPTRVYGPGPLTDANGVTKMIDLYLRGRFRFRIADGGARANYVHAADVAHGIWLAAARGRSGNHYVLGGRENLPLDRLLDMIGRLAAARRRVIALPPFVCRGIGAGGELWGKVTGETSMTRGWVEVFLRDSPVDIAPTCRRLGYRPRPLDSGLRETIDWLNGEEGVAA